MGVRVHLLMKLAVRIILHCAAIARSRINCTALFPCSPFLHYYYSCCGRLQLNGWAVCKYSQHSPPPPRPATRLTYCPAILPTLHALPAYLPAWLPTSHDAPTFKPCLLFFSLPSLLVQTQQYFFLYSVLIASFFFYTLCIEDVRDHAHVHAHAHIPARVSDAHAGLRCCVANCLTSFLTRLLHGMRTWR